jgi:hypothetical protein
VLVFDDLAALRRRCFPCISSRDHGHLPPGGVIAIT